MDDLHYIERVLKGDINAFTPLVEKYRRYVFALVKRGCKDSAEAEELAQDVFVKAYEHLGAFRGKAAFSTWLYRIAFNTAVSHARKKKRFGIAIEQINPCTYAVSDVEEQREREILMSKEQRYAAVERLLANLPTDEQMLIALYYKEELKMEEVSNIAGLSLTNTKVKIHRIRQKLNMLLMEGYTHETNE